MDDTALKQSATIVPMGVADAHQSIRHVFVRDYDTTAEIGVFSHEKGRRQRIRINVDLSVREDLTPHGDELVNVVCYKSIVDQIEDILQTGHISLVETLAEKIAESSLKDARILSSRVRVEKPDAIDGAASVGVEIERLQNLT